MWSLRLLLFAVVIQVDFSFHRMPW
jgi:hypothetical protein